MAVTGTIAAVGMGASSLASGIMGSNAYSSANKAAQGYYSQALDYEKGIYSDATTNLSPWISGGQSALSTLEGALGIGGDSSSATNYWNQFTKTPYYTFPLQQSQQSMNQAAASKGLSLSGGQLASLGKYASGYASGNWNNWISSLNSLSNTGQTAATNLGTIGSNISNQVSGTSNQQAGSAAGSILGSNAALSQGIQGLTSSLFSGSTYGNNSGNNSGSSVLSQLASLFGNSGGSGYQQNPAGTVPGL